MKKGWSKTKTDRALAQRRESEDRPDKPVREASAAELASWTSLITDVFATGTHEFGLLLHFYSGPLDEVVQLKGIEQIAARDVTGELLGGMEEDILYVFGSGR